MSALTNEQIASDAVIHGEFVVEGNPLLFPAPGEDRTVPVLLNGQMSTMLESQLLVLRGNTINDNEVSLWVQYHLPHNGELVHRSAHVHLRKPMVYAEGVAAAIG